MTQTSRGVVHLMPLSSVKPQRRRLGECGRTAAYWRLLIRRVGAAEVNRRRLDAHDGADGVLLLQRRRPMNARRGGAIPPGTRLEARERALRAVSGRT